MSVNDDLIIPGDEDKKKNSKTHALVVQFRELD
jgi:hypothetical protein